MTHRRIDTNIIALEKDLRALLLASFFDFSISKADEIILNEDKINGHLTQLQLFGKDSQDEDFFANQTSLIEALFFLVKWLKFSFTAKPEAAAQLQAAKMRSELIKVNELNIAPEFKLSLEALKDAILEIKETTKAKSVFDLYCQTQITYLFSVEVDPYAHRGRNHFDGMSITSEKKNYIVAVEFYLDDEPWANPQILKHNTHYTLKGKVQVSEWPENVTKLVFKASSVQQTRFYDIYLPPILNDGKNEFEINGEIVFNYPQHRIDQFFTIKIFACFETSDAGDQYIQVIGYHQLIAKVLDPNSVFFLVGFKGMHAGVLNTYETLNKELPALDASELNDFLKLLQGILNFQGFVAMEGLYKGIATLPEKDFRDRLIEHLRGLPYLGEEIAKEPHVGGGRIEIFYKGIIAELKVEEHISNRDTLIEKFSKQPVAYASANSKQLSILCILDLTEKTLPPSPTQSNLVLVTPKTHGHGSTMPAYPAKQAVIFIDGNTKTPSQYSV